jgi:hypothetical protein
VYLKGLRSLIRLRTGFQHSPLRPISNPFPFDGKDAMHPVVGKNGLDHRAALHLPSLRRKLLNRVGSEI